jgi:cytochrome c5
MRALQKIWEASAMASGDDHYTKTDISKSIQWTVALVVGTFALVVGIMLLASSVVRSHGGTTQNAAALTDAAVAARIKPAGEAKVDPNQAAADASAAAAPAPDAAAAAGAAATATVAAAASEAAPAAAAAVDGKATYEQACGVCHTAGIAGAPNFGDKAAWEARVATGKDALYTSALKGKNAMPAKGGNAALSDDAVKAAVDHMVSQVQ